MGISFFQCIFFYVCISCYLVDCLSVSVIQSLSLCLFLAQLSNVPKIENGKPNFSPTFQKVELRNSTFFQLLMTLNICLTIRPTLRNGVALILLGISSAGIGICILQVIFYCMNLHVIFVFHDSGTPN